MSPIQMDGGIRTDTITITPVILRLIAEIDEFKGAWTAIGQIEKHGGDRGTWYGLA